MKGKIKTGPLVLIFLVAFCALLFCIDNALKHTNQAPSIVPELQLVDFEHIQPALSVECRKWAYGYDWYRLTSRQAVERWNEIHGDIFLIEMTDSVEINNKKIKEHFEKLK